MPLYMCVMCMHLGGESTKRLCLWRSPAEEARVQVIGKQPGRSSCRCLCLCGQRVCTASLLGQGGFRSCSLPRSPSSLQVAITGHHQAYMATTLGIAETDTKTDRKCLSLESTIAAYSTTNVNEEHPRGRTKSINPSVPARNEVHQ